MLFNEPKLLKCRCFGIAAITRPSFSALQRAEIAEIVRKPRCPRSGCRFSALQRAEIAEIYLTPVAVALAERVSVLFNEPKLLKSCPAPNARRDTFRRFSALQRAEIAEIRYFLRYHIAHTDRFSALQRAEIAEMPKNRPMYAPSSAVSVLFNEPKLLKSAAALCRAAPQRVSVLFNEPKLLKSICSPTSRTISRVSVLFNEPKLLKCCASVA